MTNPMTQAERRSHTRAALIDAALKLFSDVGVVATTVDQISAAAGVTKRTFYRYFPSKEAVLFAEYEDRVEWALKALQTRPPNEPLTDCLLRSIDSFPAEAGPVVQAAALRDQLDTEVIDAHMQSVQADVGRVIEDHLLHVLKGPDVDLRAAIASRMISGAVFAAVEVWGERNGDIDDFRRMIATALRCADSGIGPLLESEAERAKR